MPVNSALIGNCAGILHVLILHGTVVVFAVPKSALELPVCLINVIHGQYLTGY